MDNYEVETILKIGGTDKEDCRMIFKINEIIFYEMQFHWFGVKDANRDFGKLPELIRRMNNVILYGDSSYRMSIDNTQINISGNIIKFWISNTHYSTLHLKVNKSLMTAFKHLYNWFYKYIKIAESSPAPTMLVEEDLGYKVVTLNKPEIPKKLQLPYDI